MPAKSCLLSARLRPRVPRSSGVGLGNAHDIDAVFFALSSDADQPHDPGHVASTSAGIQAQNTSSGLAPPISRQSQVLYEGHPVAAVAATWQLIAEQALDLIEVE